MEAYKKLKSQKRPLNTFLAPTSTDKCTQLETTLLDCKSTFHLFLHFTQERNQARFTLIKQKAAAAQRATK